MKNNYPFRVLITGLLLYLCIQHGHAQQAPIYSQYMFNKFILNPAVAGSEGYTAYNLTSRGQWVGFKDAPITNALSAQTRFVRGKFNIRLANRRLRYMTPDYGKVGIGVHVFDDRRGLLNHTGMQFTYAYHEKIELKEQLSFGITLSFSQFRVSHDRMVLFQSDKYLNTEKLWVLIPDFNAGIYYTSEYAYVGVAASQLMQSAFRFGTIDENDFRLKRNYNVMAGYRFPVTSDFSIEPSFLFKTTEQLMYQFDISTRVYYKSDFWGGIAFRTGSALLATFGARYNNLFIGYAYDFTLNKLQQYSGGSHELMLSLKFGENVRKYKWIERY
jgi:type IX secretion system PorP/SprF family membrane protein